MVPIDHDSDVRNYILRHAGEKFLQYGFSAVTTDELASDLGISKRTLYQHFRSKTDIVTEFVLSMLEDAELQLNGIVFDTSLDFATKLHKMIDFASRRTSRLREPFIRDMKRIQPKLWKRIETMRREKVLSKFHGLLETGMRTGLVRNDMNADATTAIISRMMESVLNPEFASTISFSLQQLLEQIFGIMLFGVLTPEGAEKCKTAMAQRKSGEDAHEEV